LVFKECIPFLEDVEEGSGRKVIPEARIVMDRTLVEIQDIVAFLFLGIKDIGVIGHGRKARPFDVIAVKQMKSAILVTPTNEENIPSVIISVIGIGDM
jgi:hypothetical protein